MWKRGGKNEGGERERDEADMVSALTEPPSGEAAAKTVGHSSEGVRGWGCAVE